MTEVAIVGMGAVFPGAGDAPTFWRNIVAGVDAITEVPPDRWDPAVYYRPGETGEDRFYCRRGGFVDDLAEFDPAQFGIMPNAVHGIEPDQLLVLRAAAEAVADCGTLPDGDRIGVIIGRGGYLTPGVARLDQRVRTAHQLSAVLRDLVPGLSEDRIERVRAAFCERLGSDGADAPIGLVPNFAASRLANRFDLRGPAYTVDAACASSLVAVDHAVSELESGRCDAVLAGGVHTCHHPTLWSVFSQLRALSPGERIRPFDARADGTLLAEGTGAVLLKRLGDALAAGDRVYAVIRGVGVSSDGRATSMMNPVADGQELAMRRAWVAAGLDPAAPDALGLLEGHGTATPAGDQAELTTLERVFGPPAAEPIGLGTVKSMIGHAMPAAGIAGLIKTAFAVYHGVLPPTLNICEPHPVLARTRFEPVTSTRAWDGSRPRRAAVNAFGFGGINAHVILEASPEAGPARGPAALGRLLRDHPAARPAGADPAEADPAEADPAAGVSAKSVPAEADPAEADPAAGVSAKSVPAEADPAEADPAAGVSAKSVPAEAVPAEAVPAEAILRLAAESPRELVRLLDAPDAALLGRAGEEPGDGPCRLAIVAPGPRSLALARKVAARGTPWRGRGDLWFTPSPLLRRPEQVAFLFPGFEPGFAPRIEGVAEAFGLPALRLRGSGSGEPGLDGGSTGTGPTRNGGSSGTDPMLNGGTTSTGPTRNGGGGEPGLDGGSTGPGPTRNGGSSGTDPMLNGGTTSTGPTRNGGGGEPGLDGGSTGPGPTRNGGSSGTDPTLNGGSSGGDPRDGVVEQALDVIAVSRLFAGALAGLGITAGVVAGHSLGEWTAMMVAGMYPQIDAFMASMRPGMVEVPDVVYAALGAPADRAAELAADAPGVVVSHDNCPHQSVVCGPAGQVGGLLKRARAAGIMAQTLPFRTGFHSPMYAPYLAAARETLQRLEVRPASVPIWSATSLAPFPRDPGQVRDLVLAHLVKPVRFRQLTELLHESGVRAFVQVGPGSLTGFTEDTLRDRDHLTVATAVSQRSGLAQLRRVAAALWTDGLSPRFEQLGGASAATGRAAGQGTGTAGRGTGTAGRGAGAAGQGAAAAGQPRGRARQGTGPTGQRAGGTGRGTVRLRLGGPLVRLTGAVEPLTLAAVTSAAVTPAAVTPTAVTSAAVTPAAVTSAAGSRPRGRSTDASLAPPLGSRPGDGCGNARSGANELTDTREFSLRTMPDIADHCIFPQAAGWPEDSDRFPVVPMTTLLEVMADAALAVAPGCVVTGFEQVTAARWLTVAPATTARVHAVPAGEARDGQGRVRVSIDGYASGRVRVAGAYPAAPSPAAVALHGERTAPVSVRELYGDRWMFHGPRFAGVADIASLADDGITGTVLSLPARGALLDSAGQLIGHWMQVSRSTDQIVLPTGIRAVRQYGPQPPAGDRLTVVAWIREVTGTEMRADAELRTADGRVWCLIEGWTTRRFATDDAIWRVKFRPESNTLSRAADGWTVLWERWPDTASRELMMRSYLNSAERARYRQLNPLEQRRWLLGAIAVKDAVRRWLWDRGAGPIYPAEITIDDSAGGQDGLAVRGPFRAPRVSLACRPPDGPGRACAVAIAGDDPPQFTIGSDADGTLLVSRPGLGARPLDATSSATADTPKGDS